MICRSANSAVGISLAISCLAVSCLTVLATGRGSALAGDEGRQDAAERLTVVELFTSQGCASCPPADAVLADLSREPALMPLTWAVDYWDYLGWEDTLARPEHTERQRAYGRSLGLNGVYTPQAIVDGRLQLIGSKRDELQAAIRERRENEAPPVMQIGRVGDGISVELPADAAAGPATLWLIGFDPEHAVEIVQGENGGRTVTYHNVVRSHQRLGLWQGDALVLQLTPEDLARSAGAAHAVILQEGESGPILDARRIAGE